MHIRCPHCQNAVEVVNDSELSEIACGSCGSHFSLVGEADRTATYDSKSRSIGHFDLMDELGVGAFGSVWRAQDKSLDRMVAVKIPRSGQLTQKEADQFFREARAAAQLQHPNIVSVHEIGRDNGQIYIVSDFVSGLTIADWLTGHRASVEEAAKLCEKIGRALHHAHEHGVIHRDLKPSNIMLDEENEPHIMDFGLAKREAGEITMTVEGKVLGTPAYMSPEQAQGSAHHADRRSDIYSLGVILFELLTGERPFRGNSRMLLHQVMFKEPPSPRELNNSIPKDLGTICLKCLQKQPSARYTAAAEFSDDINRFLKGDAVKARPINKLAKVFRWSKRNPTIAGLTATASMLLLAIAMVSTLLYWRESLAHQRESQLLTQVKQQRDNATQAQQAAQSAEKEAVIKRDASQQSLYTAHIVLAQQAWRVSNIRQMTRLLMHHVPDESQPDVRSWEWYYLNSLAHQEILRIPCFTKTVSQIACSPKLPRVAATGNQGQLGIWDTESGSRRFLGKAHDERVVGLAWNPDGSRIASLAANGEIKIWDGDTKLGHPLAKMSPMPRMSDVSWSTSGKFLASVSREGQLQIWDKQGKLHRDHQLNRKVNAISWSPDETRIVLAIDKSAPLMIDSDTGEDLAILDEPDSTHVAWSPDGEHIASIHGSKNIVIWNAKDQSRVFSLRARNDNPSVPSNLKAYWNPKSKYIALARSTIGNSGGVAVLDVEQKKQHIQLRVGGIEEMSWSADGTTLATAGKDGVVRIWDANKDADFQEINGLQCESIRWNPVQSRVATAGWWLGAIPLTVHQYDPKTNRTELILQDASPTFSTAWDREGKRLAAGYARLVKVFDTEALEGEVIELKGHSNQVNAVAFNPTGELLASASRDQLIKIWNPQSGKLVRDLEGHEGQIVTISWSPDGNRLASSGADHMIRIWDVDTGQQIDSLEGHPGNTVMRVQWSPDGQRLASCANTEVKIWNLNEEKNETILHGHLSLVTSLSWHPEGQRLATCGFDQTVKVWDTNRFELLLTLNPRGQFARDVSWSSDGSFLGAATFDKVTIWQGIRSN